MASTMRNMARNISNPKPDAVEQEQENPAPAILNAPEPPLEPAVASEIAEKDLSPVVNEAPAPEIVENVPPAEEAIVETVESPTLISSVEPVEEPTQPKPSSEKKNKPKPPPKKPKAADEKKVNTPKVETDA